MRDQKIKATAFYNTDAFQTVHKKQLEELQFERSQKLQTSLKNKEIAEAD